MRNLEVYFSKLPKSCLECPCFQNDEMCCGLDDGTQDFFKDEIDGGKCPLKKIHSYDLLFKKIDSLSKENFHLKKQLHKEKQEIVNEMCEKIKELKKRQTQLAIQELEKVKNYFILENENGSLDITKNEFEIAEYLITKIKELKGE